MRPLLEKSCLCTLALFFPPFFHFFLSRFYHSALQNDFSIWLAVTVDTQHLTKCFVELTNLEIRVICLKPIYRVYCRTGNYRKAVSLGATTVLCISSREIWSAHISNKPSSPELSLEALWRGFQRAAYEPGMLGGWIQTNWKWSNRRLQEWTPTFQELTN